MRRMFPFVSALEFRCCSVILLANQKLTVDEESAVSRGTIIFRREVIDQFHCKLLFFSEISKVEAIVVETVKRKTNELIVIWFKTHSQIGILIEKNFLSLGAALSFDPFRSMANKWHQYIPTVSPLTSPARPGPGLEIDPFPIRC